MDSLTMILIENKLNIPLDVMIFMNGWIKFNQLNDQNIREAVDLWFNKKEECQFKFNHISNWNTSQVTIMGFLFNLKTDFNEDISNWNVSNVTNMSWMFHNATSFTSDLSTWDVSNVRNMNGMFSYASFNGDISNWNVSQVPLHLTLIEVVGISVRWKI